MTELVAVADLHGNLPEDLPEGELLVIGGDVCPITDHDVGFQQRWFEREFYPWMERLPHPEVVWIAGNHDFVCQTDGWSPGGRGRYLLDSGTEVAGLKLWGTPWIPTLAGWAFYATDELLEEKCAAIPAGTDVVVSHGPPLGYGDRTVHGTDAGSGALRARLIEIKPRLCVFGHIHEGWGRWRLGETELANVSYVDEIYEVREGAALAVALTE